MDDVKVSFYRDLCYVNEFKDFKEVCEYFVNEKVMWVVFGDSYVVEFVYVLG